MVNKFDLMDRNTKTKNLKKAPYAQYQGTEEWVIIAHLLEELENNQDIELKTAPEYVIGYLVEKLRNKDLLLTKNQKEIIKKVVPRSKVNGRVGLRLNSR